jgi:mercuric ion binding protein
MKILANAFLLLIISISIVSCSGSEGNTQKEFYVRGNCGMCEERIEKTTRNINGVTEADYDGAKEIMIVKFDSTKTSELAIHKAIAGAGHGTDKVAMDDEAHDNLPNCCQITTEKH